MNKKKLYLERDTLKRATANIRKTTTLFEKREYSMVIVRSITAFDVYLDGILEEKLQERFSNKKIISLLLKNFSSQDKADSLMKEIYGFSLKEVCPGELQRLEKVRKERNDIVHRGTFSRKSSAEEAMDAVIELIRKIRARVKNSKKRGD